MSTITRKEHKRLILVGAALPSISSVVSKKITAPKKNKKVPVECKVALKEFMIDPCAPLMESFGAKSRLKKGVRNNLYNKI